MLIKSLHLRVTVWYALTLGLIIFVFGALIYQNFKSSLFDNLDSLLQVKAENIEDLIESAVKSIPPSSPGYLKAIESTIHEEQEDSAFVEVFDPHGKSLAISNKGIAAVVSAPVIDSALLKGNIRIQTVRKARLHSKRNTLRLLTMPVLKNSKLAYVIQVGADLTPNLLELHRLKTVLYLFLPLALFSAIFVGFFMIKMALDPVKKISKAMSRISTKNLQERIDVSGGDQEIKLLANTFNDMLGRLERSFTIQKQFIQDISHELKTPLTAMRGKQEVSLLKKRSAEDYESVLQVNLDEIEKMSHLVEDLLVLVSMDNKDSFFKMEDIDLGAIIKRAVDNMRALVQQKQITLTTSLQNQIFIKADKIQISRLLVILLDNAIKYTSSKGRIEIKLYQQGAEAKMAVSNTGAGIDKNDLPHIFERFYRADKSRNSSGFGLGLSIAKTIIDAHQGSIEATSQLGQVTVFTVSLPFAPLSKIN